MLNYKAKSKVSADKVFIIKYVAISFLIFVLAFIFLRYPTNTAQGVKQGLNLSVDILVPTLFPFLVISELITNISILNHIPTFLKKLINRIFNQPAQVFSVFLLSIIGGYPVGPTLIKKLYENKDITLEQAQRMMLFCISPGPAFVIGTVGIGMLNSQKLGLILYLSVVISALILGILTRFIKKDNFTEFNSISFGYKKCDFSQAFVDSIDRASKTMICVCAWVVFFSCITELLKTLIINDDVRNILLCVCEVTTASEFLCSEGSLPVIAAIISFGGFAVHFQVMSCIVKVKLKIKSFYISRAVHSVLSYLVCHFMLLIFPESIKTVNVVSGVSYDNTESGLSLSFVLFILSCLLLSGDNLVIKIKSKNLITQ